MHARVIETNLPAAAVKATAAAAAAAARGAGAVEAIWAAAAVEERATGAGGLVGLAAAGLVSGQVSEWGYCVVAVRWAVAGLAEEAS